jgi:hypothetical protein
MGQQIPYSTIDELTGRLRETDGSEGCPLTARLVQFDDDLSVRRIEIQLLAGEQQIDCHLYEGYWAYQTEGKITLRNVVAFLIGAAGNGIENGRKRFTRWMFGSYASFRPLGRTVLLLMIAAAILVSLIAINAVILFAAADGILFGRTNDVLTEGAKDDLTSIVYMVVLVGALFGLLLLTSKRLRGPLVRVVTLIVFTFLVLVTVLNAVALLVVSWLHIGGAGAGEGRRLRALPYLGRIATFDRHMNRGTWVLVIGVILVWAVPRIWRVGRLVLGDIFRSHAPDDSREGRWLTASLTLGLVTVVGLTGWLVLFLTPNFLTPNAPDILEVLDAGPPEIVWIVLLAVSVFVRTVLVQYVGDVAIYLTPYRLDEFFELRESIRKNVRNVARGIYRMADEVGKPYYDAVFVMGHSLGSVITYDTLNQLITDDVAQQSSAGNDPAASGGLRVAQRTALLLTFGSPLDKTAFLFSVQHDEHNCPRDALVAAAQPLLQDYRYRPQRWVNIYSPWDVISGQLDLYDDANAKETDSTNPKRVCNIKDPKATTLLAAHTEYWSNDLVYQVLHEEIRRWATGSCKPCATVPLKQSAG